jgi:hypothetical protein
MVHESSGHQAYTVNMMEYAGTKVVTAEKLSTCKVIREEITGMIKQN